MAFGDGRETAMYRRQVDGLKLRKGTEHVGSDKMRGISGVTAISDLLFMYINCKLSRRME